jgi:hypothetical protein
MRAKTIVILALSLYLFCGVARAQNADALAGSSHGPGPWGIGARTAYARLGPSERPTGGMMITLHVTRTWAFGESTSAAAGADLSAFGFDAGGRWTAILGGPTAQIRTRTALTPIFIGAGLHLDAGRIPTCSRWGLCLLYSGFFPAFSGSLSYLPSERVALEFRGSARWVNTLAWSGAGGEGGISATVRW